MLKHSLIGMVLFGVCFLFFACDDAKKASEQTGAAIVQPLITTRNTEKKVNVLQVQKSIQEFNAANGRYPADLDEVAKFNGIILESDKYEYDPATGTLTQKP